MHYVIKRYDLISIKIISLLIFLMFEANAQSIDPQSTVNPATGAMSLNIPLETVRGINGHDFPISLSYQAGIRVNQSSSPVGLGFGFGAGSISRKTVLIPDLSHGYSDIGFDDSDRGVDTAWWYTIIFVVGLIISIAISILIENPTVAIIYSSLFTFAYNDTFLQVHISDFIAGGSHQIGYDYHNGTAKGYFFGGENQDEPDIYIVSTPYVSGEIVWLGDGTSGKFVFRNNAGPDKNNNYSERIYFDKTAMKFTIKTAQGVTLIFDVHDQSDLFMTTNWEDEDNGNEAWANIVLTESAMPSTWFLSRVLFEDYIDGSSPVDDNPLTSSGEVTSGSWIVFNYMDLGNSNIQKYPYYGDYSISGPSTRQQVIYGPNVIKNRLTEIITPNEKARYNYVMDKKDDIWIENGTSNPVYTERLQSIELVDHAGAVRKTIEFETSYDLRPGTYGAYLSKNNPVPGNINGASLTLNKIKTKDKDGNYLEPIVLEYGKNNPSLGNGTVNWSEADMSVIYIPKDVWGFYYPGSYFSNVMNYQGLQSKSADAWSLSRILYPNGLALKWEYEPNCYTKSNGVSVGVKYGSGIRVKKLTVSDGLSGNYTYSYFYNGMTTPGQFEYVDNLSTGHITASPNPFFLAEGQDPRPDVTKGGFYTPAQIAYEKTVIVQNYDDNLQSAPNGYNILEFVTSADFPNLGTYGEIDESWKRGRLKSTRTYNNLNRLIKEKINHYDYIDYNITQLQFEPESGGEPMSGINLTFSQLLPNNYGWTYGWVRNSSVEENEFGINKSFLISYDLYGFPNNLSLKSDSSLILNYNKVINKNFRDADLGGFSESDYPNHLFVEMAGNGVIGEVNLDGDPTLPDLIYLEVLNRKYSAEYGNYDGLRIYVAENVDFSSSPGVVSQWNTLHPYSILFKDELINRDCSNTTGGDCVMPPPDYYNDITNFQPLQIKVMNLDDNAIPDIIFSWSGEAQAYVDAEYDSYAGYTIIYDQDPMKVYSHVRKIDRLFNAGSVISSKISGSGNALDVLIYGTAFRSSREFKTSETGVLFEDIPLAVSSNYLLNPANTIFLSNLNLLPMSTGSLIDMDGDGNENDLVLIQTSNKLQVSKVVYKNFNYSSGYSDVIQNYLPSSYQGSDARYFWNNGYQLVRGAWLPSRDQFLLAHTKKPAEAFNVGFDLSMYLVEEIENQRYSDFDGVPDYSVVQNSDGKEIITRQVTISEAYPSITEEKNMVNQSSGTIIYEYSNPDDKSAIIVNSTSKTISTPIDEYQLNPSSPLDLEESDEILITINYSGLGGVTFGNLFLSFDYTTLSSVEIPVKNQAFSSTDNPNVITIRHLIKEEGWQEPFDISVVFKNMTSSITVHSSQINVSSPFSTDKVISASAQTWKSFNNNGVYRPEAIFNWKSDMDQSGKAINSFAPFVYCQNPTNSNCDLQTIATTNSNWQLQSAITRYDNFGNVLEASQLLDGHVIRSYQSNIYDDEGIYKIAAISNGQYGEALFNSFEDCADGSVPPGANPDADINCIANEFHSGKISLRIDRGTAADPYFVTSPTPIDNFNLANSKTFVFEFWAKSDAPSTTTFAHLQTMDAGNTWYGMNYFTVTNEWNKYRFEANIPSGITKQFRVVLRPPKVEGGNFIDGNIYYDGVRAYPKNAEMENYIYDRNLGLLTETVDVNNYVAKNEFDEFGRLVASYNKRGNKILGKQYVEMGTKMHIEFPDLQFVWDGTNSYCETIEPSYAGEPFTDFNLLTPSNPGHFTVNNTTKEVCVVADNVDGTSYTLIPYEIIGTNIELYFVVHSRRLMLLGSGDYNCEPDMDESVCQFDFSAIMAAISDHVANISIDFNFTDVPFIHSSTGVYLDYPFTTNCEQAAHLRFSNVGGSGGEKTTLDGGANGCNPHPNVEWININTNGSFGFAFIPIQNGIFTGPSGFPPKYTGTVHWDFKQSDLNQVSCDKCYTTEGPYILKFDMRAQTGEEYFWYRFNINPVQNTNINVKIWGYPSF